MIRRVTIVIAVVILVILLMVLSTYFAQSHGYKYTPSGFYKSDPDESLPIKERFLDILEDSEEDSEYTNDIQEARMAQLIEYEIPDMEENEIFFVVKSKDGAIVRTTINKDLAEALLEHYK